MAQVVLRQWYVIIRRNGLVTQRLQIRVLPLEDEPELDPFVGPEYRDSELFPSGDDVDIGSESLSLLAEHEMVGCTQAWEISFVE